MQKALKEGAHDALLASDLDRLVQTRPDKFEFDPFIGAAEDMRSISTREELSKALARYKEGVL